MKRALTVLTLVLMVAVCAAAFSACGIEGVASESDLYGDFYTADSMCCITLSGENKAVVDLTGASESFYAKYDLAGGKIELRVGDRWGDTKYTLTIVDADTLKIEFYAAEVDPDNPSNTVPAGSATVLTFYRD